MRVYFALKVLFLLATIAYQGIAASATGDSRKPRRAPAPKFSAGANDVFFDDASTALSGNRPAYGKGAPGGRTDTGSTDVAPGPADPAPAGGFAWSKLISADVIEDEIKRLNLAVTANVTTPGKFNGGGFRDGRQHFSMLAALFGIASEYDGDVRFKQIAPGARDAFARAGFNCKVGTTQTFNEAKARKEDLAALVRGGSVEWPKAEAAAPWDKVVNRPPLMNWLKRLQYEELEPWTASAGAFKSNKDKVRQNGEIVAAIAEIIGRPGFEFADDDGYLQYTVSMKKSAAALISAVKLDSADGARKAVGEINKSCSACHDGYRE
jgi:hypothetical protein